MPTLLLHICCGPCATSTVDHWRAEGWEVEGFFFNPNVQPYLEFGRRLPGAQALAAAEAFRLREDLRYDPAAWFQAVGLQGGGRCARCIACRLERTAQGAAEAGYTAFRTSRAISPDQDHRAIAEEGAAAGGRHGVEFLYHDLRPLYRDSRRRARELELYRQQYCGCILSEWERYRDG